jgi:putative ABC transport system permease protein
MAVRTALGAARGRLIRQLLTESVLLATLGGIAGLALAAWSIDALRTLGGTLLPRFEEVRVDGAAIGFSLAVAMLTGIVFGLAPAVRLAIGSTSEQLREGAKGSASGGVARLRNALVLGEIAVALVLLVGAGLLLRSFARLNDVDPGFRADGVLTYSLLLPGAKYGERPQQAAFFERLVARTHEIPGVRSVSVSGSLPMASAGYLSFSIEGRQAPANAAEDLQPFIVSPEYFQTLGVPLRRGRVIEARDAGDAPLVAVVNDELARRFFDGRDPIGRRISIDGTDWWTIVGVVGNVAQEGVTAAPYPQLYFPLFQTARRFVNVAIRTDGDPLSLAAGARAALASVDPDLPVNEMQTMRDRISADMAQPRVSVAILGVFAAVALALAAIGIYGVMSYVVAQRTREIGIRVALGARAEDVVRLVVREGMKPALLGIALGLAGAFALTRLMASLLYGVSPSDPLTFGGVAAFLAIVALVATYLPARRATLVEPMGALRSE